MSNDEDKREARELLPSPRNFAPQKLLGPAPDSPHVLDLNAAPVPRAVPYELTAPEDASERFAFALWGAGRKREAIEFLERQIDLRRDAVAPPLEPVDGAGTEAETAGFPRILDPGAEDAQPLPPKSSAAAGPVPLPRPVTPADAISAAAPRRNKLRLAALAASLVLATSAVLAMNFLAPPLLGDGEGGEAEAIGEPTPLAAALPSPRPKSAEAQPVETAAASPAETGSLAPVETSPRLEADEASPVAEAEAADPVPVIAETSVEAPESVQPIEEVADATPSPPTQSGSADPLPDAEETVVATASPPSENSLAVEPEIAAPIEGPAAPAPAEEPASAALPLRHPQSPAPEIATAPGLAALAVNAPPPEDTDAPLTELSAADSAGAQLAQPPPAQASPLDPLFAALGMPESAEAALAGGAENSFAVGPRIPAPRPEFTPDMLVEEPRPTRVGRAEASPAPAPPPPDNDAPILRDVPPGGRVLYGPDGEPLVIWRAPGRDGRRFWERQEGGFFGDRRIFRDDDDDAAELAWRRAQAERYIAWRRAQHRRLLHLTFP